MKRLALLLMLLPSMALAQDLQEDTWGGAHRLVINGHDTFGGSCVGWCKIRKRASGRITKGSVCLFIIDGEDREADVVSGSFEIDKSFLNWPKYAQCKWRFQVEFRDTGEVVGFESIACEEAYPEIENSKAQGHFDGANMLWRNTAGMFGTGVTQWRGGGGLKGEKLPLEIVP